MESQKRDVNAADQLIANMTEIESLGDFSAAAAAEADAAAPAEEGKLFQRFKIKDVVFLAMMAAAMLVTGAIMPLVGQIPLFGAIQLGIGLQFSVFPAIGIMKVRKPGSLLLISLFCGVMLVFMNAIMFFCMILCALVAETIALLVFRSYNNNGATLLACTVYFPLTLPFLYVWYRFIYTWTGEEGRAVSAFLGASPLVAIAISAAVLALCFAGALIGVVVSKELKRSGVMKK